MATQPAPCFPGPDELGRGAVVLPGQAVGELSHVTRVRVDASVLADPGPCVARLHEMWAKRSRYVVELAVDPAELARSEMCHEAPYSLDPSFSFLRERLFFLVWANSYDCRSGEPIWWWSRKALRIEAGAVEAGPGDIVLCDGTVVVVDGGPRGPLSGDPTCVTVGGRRAVVVHRESVELGVVRTAVFRPPKAVLADDQLAAVGHGAGPARIIAPAGSGKTRVLTERIRHLTDDRGVEPQLITALAYNTKAAAEMRDRLGLAGRTGAQVRTVHALGFALLNSFGTRPAVLDERAVRDRLSSLVALRWSSNTDPLAPYIEAMSAVRLGLRSPADVERGRDDVPGFAAAFELYRAQLQEDNVVDFDEQVYGAIELLLRNPAARRSAQMRCRHLLVDEFQDLTPAFLLMVRLLSAPEYDVFAVGDDDQVLYSYGGADPRFLIDYDTYFPHAAHLALEVNYRCPPRVVAGAARVLAHNHVRIPKVIRAGRDDDDSAALTVERHGAGELGGRVVALVQSWLAAGVRPRDIAVLCRVNSGLLSSQVLLGEAGVPVDALLSANTLSRTGVRTVLAYLRLSSTAAGPWDGRDLSEVANRPSRRISSAARDTLFRQKSWTAGDFVAGGIGSSHDASRLRDLVADVTSLAALRATGATTVDLIRHIRDDIGLGAAMRTLDSSKREVGASHADDLSAMEAVSVAHPEAAGFEAWLRGALTVQSDPNGVRLASVHRVKGLEFDRVCLVGAAAPTLPHDLSDDVEEERRIFHVAITRTRHQVVILADKTAQAPFLAELDGSARPPAKGPLKPAKGRRSATGRPAPAVASSPQTIRRPRVAPKNEKKAAPARSGVTAEVGLVVSLPGGYDGTIVELGADGAYVALDGGSRMLARYRSTVTFQGRPLELREPAAAPVTAQAVSAATAALQQWRKRTAADGSMPEGMVIDDATLAAVAERCPTSMEELARCRGMGPTRLSRWGDDILIVLEGLAAGSEGRTGP